MAQDDLIGNSENVVGQVVFRILKNPDGTTATNVEFSGVDELTALGLIAKGTDIIKALFLQQSMPRVTPVNGMPDALKRHLRG